MRETDTKQISDLQKEILKHVCLRKNADYKTLSKATDRDRITLLQSLQSLMNSQLVYKEKDSSNLIKSKLIFKPTHKGRAYAITFLGMDLDDIRNAQSDDNERKTHAEFIKVADRDGRKKNERQMMADLLRENLFQEDGNIPDIDKFLYQLARVRLLKFIRTTDFDLNQLFGTRGTKELKAISTKSELKELKKLLNSLRDNIDSSIKCLPG